MTDVYNLTGREDPIILDKGTLDEYYWVIISLGSHPCAYVGVGSDHPLFAVDYDEMYEKDISIDCHGGVTYTDEDLLKGEHGFEGFIWWIGWDYAHLGDQYYTRILSDNGKKWTVKEIKCEVLDVITQLKGAKKK